MKPLITFEFQTNSRSMKVEKSLRKNH